MATDQALAAALRASIQEAELEGYQIEPEDMVRTETENDEEIARELQRQLNDSAGLPLATTASMYEKRLHLARQKTYTGAYYGRDRQARPCFTYTMMVICTLFLIFELVANNNQEGQYFEDFTVNPLFGPSLDTLIFMGAKRADLIVEEGEFWRLFMPIILHGGILHLIFNLLFLYSFGMGLEAEFGHIRIAYIFLVSGFFGVLISAIFNPTIVSVGASGACYGLIGAAWADFWLNFGFYKQGNWKGWLAQLTFGTILNLALGLIPTLDNFTHIGGFLAGFFAGLTVLTLPRYDFFEELKPDKLYQIVLKSCAIFLIPVLIVIGIIVLYTGVNVNQLCPWCQYLSCIPTPWWSCDLSCAEGFQLTFPPDGNVVIECPQNIIVIVPPPFSETLRDNQDERFEFCTANCF